MNDGGASDGGDADSDKKKNEETANEKTEGDELSQQKPKRTLRSREKKPRPVPSKLYWVTGQVRGIKKNKRLVIAGTAEVQIEMDESTQVEIDLEDLQYLG